MVRLTKSEFLANIVSIVGSPIREPIRVPDAAGEGLVVMSAAEYEKITHGERRVLRIEDLSDAEIALIETAEVPAEFAHLDDEMDED